MSPLDRFCQSEHHSGSSLLRGSVSPDLHFPAEPVHLRPGRASLLLSARCPLEHTHHVGQRCASYGMEIPLFVSALFVVKTSRRFELRRTTSLLLDCDLPLHPVRVEREQGQSGCFVDYVNLVCPTHWAFICVQIRISRPDRGSGISVV